MPNGWPMSKGCINGRGFIVVGGCWQLGKVASSAKRLSENHLGRYTIHDMVIRTADEAVLLSPIGRNVVGAQGRVDVTGDAAESMIVLQTGSRWGIITARYP